MMKSNYIYECLKAFYTTRQNKYVVKNCFVFGYWESDFFVQSKAKICTEFEVKISRADFFADFKKEVKHLTLKNKKHYGEVSKRVDNKWVKEIKETNDELRIPNFFYYAVPDGMITIDEVPEYAGLIYVGEYQNWKIVKKAPRLHKKKLDMESPLCNKFYYYWLSAESKLRWQDMEVKNLKKEIEQLKSNLKQKTV